MMTVDRFEVTIELMPLLQGEIRVTSMKLRRPIASVSVDDSGTVDWFLRNEASKSLDPDRVVLENVEISEGRITYTDARTGISRVFDRINAQLEAASLYGPWRVDGSYLDAEQRVPFRISTGRRAESGAIRVKTELSPANWAVTLNAEGEIANNAEGVSYSGTYNLAEVVPVDSAVAVEDRDFGWRSEGAFTLTRDRLVIDKAVLSEGPPERPYSVAGSLTVELGAQPYFDAAIVARQLDLDRSLGRGPAAPVEPAKASESLVQWLSTLYIPPIRGRLAFSVPGIIVGGAVIQDASFKAEPREAGWKITDLRASLPGQATIEASGSLTTVGGVGFNGDIHLAVRQPASFASWWRGKAEQGAGRLLAPFDLSGRAVIAPGQIGVDALAARIGDATVRGRFAWTEAKTKDRRRHLGTDLAADRIDSTQLRALSELLIGRNLTDTGVVADSYAVKLSSRELVIDDLTMRNVAVDASLADDALTVNEFRIGDIGGASINVTQGRIDNPLKSPRGRLEAKVAAPESLAGLAGVVDSLLPGSAVATWLKKAAPSLIPAVLDARIEAPPADAKADFRLGIKGVAASTTLDATFDIAGSPLAWRSGAAGVSLTLDSPDAVGLARQLGFTVPDISVAGGSHIEFSAAGVPATGLDLSLAGDFGGLTVSSAGKLALPLSAPATYAGSLKLDTADLDPLMRLAELSIPGAAAGTAIRFDGTLATTGLAATATWENGTIGDRLTGGKVTVGRSDAGRFEFGGDLTVDEVDLAWIMSLGLGFAIEPTGDRFSPWSKAPFAEPAFGNVGGRLNVSTERFSLGEGLGVTNARLAFDLDPVRIAAELQEGAIFGGAMTGALAINNVGGNTNVSGRADLKGAALDAIAWQPSGRPVVTGVLDFSTNFDATGRSPAGLVSSLTGGGSIEVRNGEARYLNPRAVQLIIRASDLGQEFSEEALQDAFGKYIDGGDLPFRDASAAFSVAAGTVRVQSLAISADGASLTGGATVDLNTLGLDSVWTLVFDIGDEKAKGTVPQVGLIFRGPLAEPARTIDVVQFGAYLNIRQEERIQEILNLEAADRAEKERLNRLKRKLREDAVRRQRDLEAAAAAEAIRLEASIAAGNRLEAFHQDREIRLEARAAAALAAARTAAAASETAAAAEAATQARIAAEAEADQAAGRAAAARADAKEAAERARTAVEERAAAAKALARAEADRDAAAKAASSAAERAQAARLAVASATKASADRAAAEVAARAAAERAAGAKATADAAAAEQAGVEQEAEERAAKAADADATAVGDAAARAVAVNAAEGAVDAAGKAVLRSEADVVAAKARLADAAAQVAATEAARVAAEKAKAEADEAARIAATATIPSVEGEVVATLPPTLTVDLPAAAAALAEAIAAAEAALADQQRATEASVAAEAAVPAARAKAEAARAALDKAIAERQAADAVVVTAAAARLAAENDAAVARANAAEAASIAAEKSVAVIQTTAAIEATARQARTTRAAAEAAAKDAAAAIAAEEAAAATLAERVAAMEAAEAVAAGAAEAEVATARAAEEAAAASAAADAEAKRTAEAVKTARAAEARAKGAAEDAAAEAARRARELSAVEPGPATLTPVAGDSEAPARPRRTPRPRPQPEPQPMVILPQVGQ